MSPGKIIRQQVKALEADMSLMAEIRSASKTEAGRLTPFGRGFIVLAKQADFKQTLVAKILDISPGATSRHYANNAA